MAPADPSGASEPRGPEELTDDGFLDCSLRILQPVKGYRAAIDAVMLAAAVPAGSGNCVLEAGIGAGVASLCLAKRVDGVTVTGVEAEPAFAELARENAARNGLAERVCVIEGDVRDQPSTELQALAGTFDHVFANPPYLIEGRARAPASATKARAQMGGKDDLAKWIAFLATMAARRGTLTLIHRADAMGHVLAALEPRFGGLIVYPLFPRAGAPASRVIVQGVNGSRAPLSVQRGLVLHEADGSYTQDADAVLREGRALVLGHEKKEKAAATGG